MRATIILVALAGPAWAHAGEVDCHYEGGVLVVPAEVAGAAGDYILDTGDPLTRLHETRAQSEGFEGASVTGPVLIAGQRLAPRAVAITSLDARTYALPTPVAGVIGADALGAFVVDVSFAPCRVRLSRPGAAPRFTADVVLPLVWRGGLPAAPAAVAAGRRAERLFLAPATGTDLPVRLSDAVAGVPNAKAPRELYPGGVGFSRLRAVSFAGALTENPRTALIEAGGADGLLGSAILDAWRLRFDFPGGRLLLAPAAPHP